MAIADNTELSRIPKKARKKLHITGMDKELKFSKSDDLLREFFLENIAKADCQIVWGAIDKHKAMKDLREKKDKLYNYLCGRVLCDTFKRVHSKSITVVLDRRTAKRANRNDFNRYVQDKLIEIHAGNFVPDLKVSHFDSINCQCLQVHDFAVGAVFQHIERGNDLYINIISDKIVYGEKYW